jgi:hypothetical protein
MMQRSFSGLEYAQKKKQTQRDRFLQGLEAVVPWSVLDQVITPPSSDDGSSRASAGGAGAHA